jgi:hypothetical protein
LFSKQKYFQSNSFYILGNCPKAHRIITEKMKGLTENDAFHQKVGYKECSISYQDLDQFLSDHSSSHHSPSHNIIFSSEEFSSLDYSSILSLQKMLSGYEVKVVIVYRLWIQLIYSYFNQHSKSFRGKPFFESYLNENSLLQSVSDHSPFLDSTTTRKVLISTFSDDLIQKYKLIFKPQNIIVIDYYGMLADHRDINQVLVCDILALCSKTNPFSFSSSPSSDLSATFTLPSTSPHIPSQTSSFHLEHNFTATSINHSELLYSLQYLDCFNQYLRLYHSCRLRYQHYYYLNSSHTDITHHLWDNFTLSSLPLLNKSNTFLIQQSLDQDRLIRSRHADVHWLYPNPNSNQHIAKQFTYQEINLVKLVGSKIYSLKFLNLKEYFEKKNVIICQRKKS